MSKLRHLFGDQGELIDSMLDALEAAEIARHVADPDYKREVMEAAEPLRQRVRKLAADALQVTEVRVLHQCPQCGHREEAES